LKALKPTLLVALVSTLALWLALTIACGCGDDDDDDSESDANDDTDDDVDDDIDDDIDDDVNDDVNDDADDDTGDPTTTTTVTTTTTTTTTTDDGSCRFRINTTGVDENTWNPDVAMDPAGNFIVVWNRNTDASDTEVFGQLYDADGTAQRGEIRINSTSFGSQGNPAVAMDDGGNFVVVWANSVDIITWNDVYGRRFDAGGNALGTEFQINTYTAENQSYPDVAIDADGDFVAVWQSNDQDGDGTGVFGQRFDSDGIAQEAEFQINTTILNNQLGPRVAMDTDGDFAVTWLHAESIGPEEIYAQRFNAAGVAQGAEFQVNTYTDDLQFQPAVAMDGDGDFVATWTSDGQDGFGYGIYAQMYDAAGGLIGGEFGVNTTLEGGQNDSDIARNAAGDFVIVWDDHGTGAFAQRYGDPGAIGGELTVWEDDHLNNPRIAVDANANFVVVWRIECMGGTPCGLYGRRFDVNGNPVCPGENSRR
jgi:hypothetical protein